MKEEDSVAAPAANMASSSSFSSADDAQPAPNQKAASSAPNLLELRMESVVKMKVRQDEGHWRSGEV